jgi:transposase
MMVRAVIDCGPSKAAAAREFNVTPKSVAKWGKRFRGKGLDRLARPLPAFRSMTICWKRRRS